MEGCWSQVRDHNVTLRPLSVCLVLVWPLFHMSHNALHLLVMVTLYVEGQLSVQSEDFI